MQLSWWWLLLQYKETPTSSEIPPSRKVGLTSTISWSTHTWLIVTPLKFNIAHEKCWLEDGSFPIGKVAYIKLPEGRGFLAEYIVIAYQAVKVVRFLFLRLEIGLQMKCRPLSFGFYWVWGVHCCCCCCCCLQPAILLWGPIAQKSSGNPT